MAEKRTLGKPKSGKVFGHPPHRARKSFRAGLYALFSTNDQQTLAMQSRAMRAYATRRERTSNPYSARSIRLSQL